MTTKSRSLGRLPKDIHARERLREAQVAEAKALTKVCAAEETLSRATDVQRQAERELADAQAALIDISGLQRAAALLNTTAPALRRGLQNVSDPDARVAGP
jgi:hypothetical protein